MKKKTYLYYISVSTVNLFMKLLQKEILNTYHACIGNLNTNRNHSFYCIVLRTLIKDQFNFIVDVLSVINLN